MREKESSGARETPGQPGTRPWGGAHEIKGYINCRRQVTGALFTPRRGRSDLQFLHFADDPSRWPVFSTLYRWRIRRCREARWLAFNVQGAEENGWKAETVSSEAPTGTEMEHCHPFVITWAVVVVETHVEWVRGTDWVITGMFARQLAQGSREHAGLFCAFSSMGGLGLWAQGSVIFSLKSKDLAKMALYSCLPSR